MKKVEITEKQRDALCYEIARLLLKFRKNQKMDCIYFTPYSGIGETDENVLKLTLVERGLIGEERKKQIEMWNRMYEKSDSVKKLGFKIHLDLDEAYKYTVVDTKRNIKRGKVLLNSTILFDATGEYKRLQKDLKYVVTGGVPLPNRRVKGLAEVVPPLSEKMDYQIEIRRMEEEQKALEDFTKTKLFEHIMNM